MRLGLCAVPPHRTAEEWGDILIREGYRATTFPVDYRAKDAVIEEYLQSAKDRDILIAEVGVWTSPFAKDPKKAQEAREKIIGQLKLADRVRARCCVNVSGSTGAKWYFAYRENFSRDMFLRNVEFLREIIDEVRPVHTFYTLEAMPWMVPDSPKQYRELLDAVGREAFAVHLDAVNLMKDACSYVHAEEVIDEAFRLLGPKIRSCHLKDCLLEDGYSVAIREVLPGTGEFPIAHYVRRIGETDPDMPVLMEHLPDLQAYKKAKENIERLLKEAEGGKDHA